MSRVKHKGIWASVLFLLTNGMLLAWVLCKSNNDPQFYPGIDLFMAGVEALAGMLCFHAFLVLRRERSQRQWMPFLLGLGVVSTFIGQAINVYYDLNNLQLAYPSVADVFYLGAYPLYLWGILRFPAQRLSATARGRLGADGLMMILVLGTLIWYFLLGPTILQAQGAFALQLTSVAYPFADLLLIFCLILLYAKRSSIGREYLLPLALLTAGLLCITISDTVDGMLNINNIPTSSFEFLGWSSGYLLMGIAMQVVVLRKHREGTAAIENPSWKQSLLPYVLVATLIPFIFVVWTSDSSGIVANGTYIGCILLIGVLLLRQILAIKAAQEANSRLASLATTDVLTNLPNHGSLLNALDQELERARRYGRSLSLLFFDGDRFKHVNDSYGHAVGDLVLKELGARVRVVLRGGDTVGRFGGEEFLVILPETTAEEAGTVAEHMRKVVAAQPLATGGVEGGVVVTVSIGLVSFPENGATSSELLEQADQAMYWAKRLGRNQVRTAAEAAQANRDAALKAATAQALERRELTALGRDEANQHMRIDQLGLIYSLMSVLEWRAPGMSQHAHEVSDLVAGMARALKFDPQRALHASTAAFLHDIGKIALPDRLLEQPRSRFSAQEWGMIEQHAELGSAIVETSPWLGDMAPAIRHHHERWDGGGYPEGLAGSAIPLEARMIAVAEAYDTMVNRQLYQEARSNEEALEELERCAGTQFDAELVGVLEVALEQRQEVTRTIVERRRRDLLPQV